MASLKAKLLLFILLVSSLSAFPFIGAQTSLEPSKEVPTEFKPEVEFSKWDNESYLRVEYVTTEDQFTTISLENNQYIWKGSKQEVAYYLLPDSDQYDEGYEFEVVLKEKPLSNIFTFKIETENLVFYYQPPLNEETWPEGYTVNATHALNKKGELDSYRPENIVGSYAVYHSTKRDNEYTTGKAFHIYRPEAIDSKGNRIWCDLNIDIKLRILSITVPPIFLNSLNYPIIIDPSFGKTDVGGSSSAPGGNYALTHKHSLVEDGTITELNIYLEQQAASTGVIGAIYDDSGGDPNNLDGTTLDAIVASEGWYNFTYSPSVVESSGTYHLAYNHNVTNINGWYDNGAADQYSYKASAYPSFPNPFGVQEGGSDRIWSIYANYTVGAANNAPSNDAASISNMDDSDNLYSQLRSYNFIFNVSDADGVAELDTILYSLNGTSDINGSINCQTNAHAFSQGSGWVTAGSVTNVTSGNTANYTLPLTTQWDIPEEGNWDIQVWVNDTEGDDSGWSTLQTNYFDTVNSTVTANFAATDTRINRGGTATISGEARYANDPSSNTSSALYPPNAEFTAVHIHNSTHDSEGSDATVVNGAFSVTVTLPGSVGNFTYHPYIDFADADGVDGDPQDFDEVWAIADRVNITLHTPDTRIDVSTSAGIHKNGTYEFDGAAFSGTVTLNDTETKASPGNYSYSVQSITDPTYSLTAFLGENETWCVFDRHAVQTLQANSTTMALNEMCWINFTIQSEFDAHVLNGTLGDTVTLEDSDGNTYQGIWNETLDVWETNRTEAIDVTRTLNTYDSMNEANYTITVLNMNSTSLILVWGAGTTGNTFDLRVVNSSGLGIEDCTVTLTNTTDTIFSVDTNSTGHIAQQTVDSGNYTLTITKDGYITYEHDYEINDNIYWIIKLYTIEEGTVIQNSFNIELLILAGLSTLFTLIAWNDDPKDGIVRSAIAFFLWSTTSLWWMWETAGTEQIHFMYVFWMLALVSVMLFMSKLLQSYRYVGKKGAWIE